MVFELMIRPHEAEKHPWKIFLLSFFFSMLGYFLAIKFFPKEYSTASVLITALFLAPFTTAMFISEEKNEERGKDEINRVIEVFWMIFLGVMLSYSSLYFTPLPKPEAQISEINRITGYSILPESIGNIVSNNLMVLLITYLLSFLFGATAIMIIVWNASVVGTWAAKVTESSISQPNILSIISNLVGNILSISLHGSLEFTAYFLAAIAGGIISISLLRKKIHEHLHKSVLLFTVSVFLIIIAGIIEGIL